MAEINNQKAVDELIQQWASLQQNLVEELAKMKRIYGSEGTKRFLKEALAKYHLGSSTSGAYLMRLINISEKLQRAGISRSISDQIPLSSWMKIINFVSFENAQEIVNYLYHKDGQLKTLVAKLKQGYYLRFNLFSGEYDFIKRKS